MEINDFIESVMVRSEIEHGSTPVYIRTMGNTNSEFAASYTRSYSRDGLNRVISRPKTCVRMYDSLRNGLLFRNMAKNTVKRVKFIQILNTCKQKECQ